MSMKTYIIMVLNGCKGIAIGFLKLFLLLIAGDIVIFSETEQGLQEGLYVLSKYWKKSKLVVNVNKTKVMVFRKRGRLTSELEFYYYNNEVGIVGYCFYNRGGGSFKQTFDSLRG